MVMGMTRDNGWRMVVVIELYPGLINTLIWLISRSEATVMEETIIAMLYYVCLAVEIFALSLAYKALVTLTDAYDASFMAELLGFTASLEDADVLGRLEVVLLRWVSMGAQPRTSSVAGCWGTIP